MTLPVEPWPTTGVLLRGTIWCGGSAEPVADALTVLDAGRVVSVTPAELSLLSFDAAVLGGPDCWVLPGIVDAHVHLSFGGPADELAGGVVAVRDLGAPADDARAWRTAEVPRPGSPAVAVAGPLLTAPGGYPSKSWGRDGFAFGVADPAGALDAVRDVVADGVDVVKVALEPAGGAPVPALSTVEAIVEAAHGLGVAVTAHALTVAMVERALDARVDELCHTPVERLPEALVGRIVEAGVRVVSTIETLTNGDGDVVANAAALVAAGVPLVYGSDLGNAGTRPGVDHRELGRLADAGLGPWGALRSATELAASTAGVRGPTGKLVPGSPAYAVVLDADPTADSTTWERPVVVVTPTGVIRLRLPDR